jgi:hypothetical protein
MADQMKGEDPCWKNFEMVGTEDEGRERSSSLRT